MMKPYLRQAVWLMVLTLLVPAVPRAANLVTNGSFEEIVDGKPTHWRIEGDRGVRQSLRIDTGVTTGSAARLACTSLTRVSRESLAALSHCGLIPLQQGHWYRFSCWARQEGIDSAMITAELVADAAATLPYNTTVLFKQMVLSPQWRYQEHAFLASSAGTVNSRLDFSFDTTGTLWLDDVQIVEIDSPQPRYTREVPPIGSRNLLPNGSFECGSAYWSSLATEMKPGCGLEKPYGDFQSPGAFAGDYCLKIGLKPAQIEQIASDVSPCTPYDVPRDPLITSLGFIPVRPGQNYTLSAYLRADRSAVPARMSIHFLKPFGGHSLESKKISLGIHWERFTLTAPANSEYAYIQVGPDLTGRPHDEAIVWIDAIQFEQAPSATRYESREPLEIGFDFKPYGNIFTTHQLCELAIQACNAGAMPMASTVQFSIRDYFDREVAQLKRRVGVPASQTRIERCPLPLDRPGFYSIQAAWEAGGRHHQSTIPLAIIEPYNQDDSLFGINNPPGNNALCEPLHLAGVSWARCWTMNWQRLEPAPGQFAFQTADFQVNRLLDAPMRIHQMLPPFPSTNWNSTAPAGAEEIAPDYGWGTNFYAPKDKKAMRAFVQTVVTRYKDRLHSWEYLNEPFYTIHSLPNVTQMDSTIPALPKANYSVRDYIRLLKVFHKAVKSADPNALTVGGLGARPDLLTREFFAAGGLKHLDVFNLHIYPGLRRPEAYIQPMEQMLRWMDASGGRKPIWITEYSYFGVDQLPWEPYIMNPTPWAPNRLLANEKQCADYTIRFNAVMLAHGVEKIFYHSGHVMDQSLNDDVSIMESPLHGYGAVPRKLYAAQAAMASILGPRPRFAGALAKPANESKVCNGIGYSFQCGSRAVMIAWKPDSFDDGDGFLQLPSFVKAQDIVGAPMSGQTIPLGESPIYAVSSELTASELTTMCILKSTTCNERIDHP